MAEPALHPVHTRNGTLHLTRRERALYALLVANPGQVRTRDSLVDALDVRGPLQVDSTATRLRVKLAALDLPPIRNVWGVGYRIDPDA